MPERPESQTEDSVTKQSRSEQNAELAAPLVIIRVQMAEIWAQIQRLSHELGLKVKPKISEKILKQRAASWHIRIAIQRILAQPMPERAKSGTLLTYLAEVDELSAQAAMHRNEFLQHQRGLAMSFFDTSYKDYCSNLLDLPTRKALAEEAVLRAAETFDPAKGEFSTYAFQGILKKIRSAWEKERKHTRISLDAPRKGAKKKIDGTMHGIILDHRVQEPSRVAQRREMIATLRHILEELPTQWRVALELTAGLTDDHRCYSPEEAARIMNERGIVTINKGVAVTAEKIRVWVMQAKRVIARKRDLFR